MPELSCRQACRKDLPRLVEIYNGVIAEGGFTADLHPFNLAQRQSWFDAHQQPPFLIYVVEIDCSIVGYFYFSPWRAGRAALKHVAEVSYYLSPEVREGDESLPGRKTG